MIKSFVKEDFVKEIDFTTLQRNPNTFVTETFKERETDVIWKVECKGRAVFFYILIEFQSTVDYFMALRLLTYILLLYEDLLNHEPLKRLPSVFPIVLYKVIRDGLQKLALRILLSSHFPHLSHTSPPGAILKLRRMSFPKLH